MRVAPPPEASQAGPGERTTCTTEIDVGNPTVPLEELAAEFGLRTTDAINRVQGLEQMGRLTGVMDDRGKYIYISPEEMEAVATFIQERGRGWGAGGVFDERDVRSRGSLDSLQFRVRGGGGEM